MCKLMSLWVLDQKILKMKGAQTLHILEMILACKRALSSHHYIEKVNSEMPKSRWTKVSMIQ